VTLDKVARGAVKCDGPIAYPRSESAHLSTIEMARRAGFEPAAWWSEATWQVSVAHARVNAGNGSRGDPLGPRMVSVSASAPVHSGRSLAPKRPTTGRPSWRGASHCGSATEGSRLPTPAERQPLSGLGSQCAQRYSVRPSMTVRHSASLTPGEMFAADELHAPFFQRVLSTVGATGVEGGSLPEIFEVPITRTDRGVAVGSGRPTYAIQCAVGDQREVFAMMRLACRSENEPGLLLFLSQNCHADSIHDAV